MQRNQNPGQQPGRNAERDAAQPAAVQPRADDEDESLHDPDQVPSFLTAQELQAREPGKGEARKSPDDDEEVGEESEEPAKRSDKPLRKAGKSR